MCFYRMNNKIYLIAGNICIGMGIIMPFAAAAGWNLDGLPASTAIVPVGIGIWFHHRARVRSLKPGTSSATNSLFRRPYIFPECKKAFWKTCVGFLVSGTSIPVFYYGVKSETWALLSAVVGLGLIVVGPIMVSAYLGCVFNYNKTTSNDQNE